jgi:hypothetical protein
MELILHEAKTIAEVKQNRGNLRRIFCVKEIHILEKLQEQKLI